ncbi:MAG TPA: protein kinase [Vicinamibacterales bacterium]|nr:protein kinase [Vicinamibacterales bacterium]
MDAKEHWQRLAAILEAAFEVPADGRAAFVREACAGDAELHAEVAALLAAHAQSGRFLDGSALALVGDTGAVTVPVAPSSGAPRFADGQIVGRYRIQHLIGTGGMGEVYAADEMEHGRRVALKVMKGQLPSGEARNRFVQEGRLASAVNHPNSVYVFGSEIIDGYPVIVMELLEGGTLKDLVQSAGPLPTTHAVDAIVQLIAGVEAAHAGGILHRDIKPGNCFIDRDGVVKIGDFGVSVATGAELTRYLPASAIQVTPQYAAPEQIRGAVPDVRADIYAVGATLFYLLTGRAPFDDENLLALLSRIQTDAPPSPRAFVSSVPRGLAAVVLRCLAKNPDARYPTYAALRGELLPFRSGDSDTVPVAVRLVAAAIDQVVVLLITTVINPFTFAVAPGSIGAEFRYLICAGAYFLATEGFASASLGKRVFGLSVADEDGGRPRLKQIAIRTAVFLSVAVLPFLPSLDFWVRVLGPSDLPPFYERAALFARISVMVSLAGRLAPLALFVAARRSNRWAGLHERLSGTRVARVVAEVRATAIARGASRAPDSLAGYTGAGRRGPFVLSGTVPAPAGAAIWQALDPVLQRDVWVRDIAAGSSLSSPERRRLARPGRLRWLGGQAGASGWEAFEAPRGEAWSAVTSRPLPWAVVREWLADLAGELAACDDSGETITFTLDHVWITATGRVMLLDFPAPGAQPSGRPVTTGVAPSVPAQRLLRDVARTALPATAGFLNGDQRIQSPLPPAGMALLRALRDPRGIGAGDMHRLARHASAGATAVPRWSRVVPAVALLIPLVLLTISVGRASSRVGQPLLPGVGSDEQALFNALVRVDRLERAGVAATDPQREALELYLARRYEGLAARAATFEVFLAPYRSLAETIAGRHPVSTTGELEAAFARIGRDELDALNDPPRIPVPILTLLPILALPLIAVVGAASVVMSAVLRGGVLWTLLRCVVVDESGDRATRLRAAARALVAWAPAFALLPMRHHVVRAVLAGNIDSWVILAAVLVAFIATAGIVALVVPARGIPERVSGTWITPA